jgi:hypothetical protein
MDTAGMLALGADEDDVDVDAMVGLGEMGEVWIDCIDMNVKRSRDERMEKTEKDDVC